MLPWCWCLSLKCINAEWQRNVQCPHSQIYLHQRYMHVFEPEHFSFLYNMLLQCRSRLLLRFSVYKKPKQKLVIIGTNMFLLWYTCTRSKKMTFVSNLKPMNFYSRAFMLQQLTVWRQMAAETTIWSMSATSLSLLANTTLTTFLMQSLR